MPQPPRRSRRAHPRPIRVRMYNVGFGDCFLVVFPATAEQPVRKVLFDCGSIKSNPAQSTKEVVAQLVDDIAAESPGGVPHLDVVVATHRHADHISGFNSELWQTVVVGEVWMPWTESEEDVEAIRLRAKQERLALALSAAFPAAPGSGELLPMLAADAVTNAEAVETLKRGFAGNPKRRFLEAATSGSRLIETPILPGISVHLLGPSRDAEALKAMDPHPDESFLALWAAQPGGAPGERPAPFPDRWRSASQGALDPSTEEAVRTANDALGGELAFRLDSVLNNTSLMLVFVVGKAVMLFPGDAQWGSWKAALGDPESRRLLDHVTFLKVGHHGSHNSTPQTFVHQCLAPRKVKEKIASMISVVPRGTWDIPRQPLVDALMDVTKKRTVRSDDKGPPAAPFSQSGQMWIEAEVAY